MKCKEIYDSALRVLAESTLPADNDDYEERAPYLIATFCGELAGTDAALRRIMGKGVAKEFNEVYLSLDNDFPLLSRFASAAALYLAAMLIIDDEQDFSDKLYDRYCDKIASICSTVPALSEKIRNKYFFD